MVFNSLVFVHYKNILYSNFAIYSIVFVTGLCDYIAIFSSI